MKKKYPKIIEYLIEQSKNPKGFVGNIMINIWNKVFEKMTLWGVSHVKILETDVILEIGFGGGKFINYLAKEKNVSKIYGLDISDNSFKKGVKLNYNYINSGKVVLLKGIIREINFCNKFDKIFAIQTHIYWDSFEKDIQKIFDIINIDGEFNIICEKDKIRYHLNKYNNKELMIEFLKKIGFNTVNIFENKNWIQYQCFKENIWI